MQAIPATTAPKQGLLCKPSIHTYDLIISFVQQAADFAVTLQHVPRNLPEQHSNFTHRRLVHMCCLGLNPTREEHLQNASLSTCHTCLPLQATTVRKLQSDLVKQISDSSMQQPPRTDFPDVMQQSEKSTYMQKNACRNALDAESAQVKEA